MPFYFLEIFPRAEVFNSIQVQFINFYFMGFTLFHSKKSLPASISHMFSLNYFFKEFYRFILGIQSIFVFGICVFQIDIQLSKE